MERRLICTVVLLVAIGLTFLWGCGEEPTAPTTGVVKGTLSLKAGISGNLDNTAVKLYTDTSFKDLAQETKASGTADATFTFAEVSPGTYYLLFWKDLNGNTTMDWADFVGYAVEDAGTLAPLPIQVSAGDTIDITVEVDYFGGGTLFYDVSATRFDWQGFADLLTIYYTCALDGTLDSLEMTCPDPALGGIWYLGWAVVAGIPDSVDIQVDDPGTQSWPDGQYVFDFKGKASYGTLSDLPFSESDTVDVQ